MGISIEGTDNSDLLTGAGADDNFGADSMNDASAGDYIGHDVVKFSDSAAEELFLVRQGNDLKIFNPTSAASLMLIGWYGAAGDPAGVTHRHIDEFESFDGIVLLGTSTALLTLGGSMTAMTSMV